MKSVRNRRPRARPSRRQYLADAGPGFGVVYAVRPASAAVWQLAGLCRLASPLAALTRSARVTSAHPAL